MGREHLIQFRVDDNVAAKVDRTSKILGNVSRSEAARFLLYIGISFIESMVNSESERIVMEAFSKFMSEKQP